MPAEPSPQIAIVPADSETSAVVYETATASDGIPDGADPSPSLLVMEMAYLVLVAKAAPLLFCAPVLRVSKIRAGAESLAHSQIYC